MTTDDVYDHRDPILPGDDEREALSALRAFLESDGGNGLALVGSDGEQVALPASASRALRRSVAVLSDQRAVSLIPMGLKIGPEQAGRMLQLPLEAVYELLESQELASFSEDGMLWIALEDALSHREKLRRERRNALDELARQSQEFGLYELNRT